MMNWKEHMIIAAVILALFLILAWLMSIDPVVPECTERGT